MKRPWTAVGHVVGDALGEARRPSRCRASSPGRRRTRRRRGAVRRAATRPRACSGLPSGVVQLMVAPVGYAGAGGVADVDLRPAELLDPAVLPDARAVVERAVAVGVLLDDQHDGVVVELHRHVEPPHALERRVGRRPGGSASPTGRIPQERSRLPSQRSRDRRRSPRRRSTIVPLQVPTWAKRWASRVTRLPERITCGCSWTHVAGAVPGQVERDPVGLLEDDPEPSSAGRATSMR